MNKQLLINFAKWYNLHPEHHQLCETPLVELFLKEYPQHPPLTVCYNCGEVVEMVSEGEFCPKCFY